MIASRRRLIGAGIAAMALAMGLGTAAATTSAAPAAASTVSAASVQNMPSCETGGLAVWVNQHGKRKPDVFYFRLEFTNLTNHACWLRGYPDLYAMNMHGGLGSMAVHEHGTRVVTAVLQPHGTAHALLGYRYPLISSQANCRAAYSDFLRVHVPRSWGVNTFFVKGVCSVRNGVKDLTIRPIWPGL